MQVDIGPVEATSATAFIDYARAVLEGYGLQDEPLDGQVGSDVVKNFRSYLDQWAQVAKRGGDFKWTADVDLEQVEYLVHAFYRVAGRVTEAAEERGLCLIAFHREVRFVEITEVVHRELIDQGGELLRRGDELHKRFTALSPQAPVFCWNFLPPSRRVTWSWYAP